MRDPETPVGRVPRSRYGLLTRVQRVQYLLDREGPQRLFMDDVGNVLSMQVGMTAEQRMCAEHPEWLLGTYQTTGCKRGPTFDAQRASIIADVNVRWQEIDMPAEEPR